MKAVFDWMLTVGSALSQLAYAVFANSHNSNLSISGEAYFNRKRSRLRYMWYRFINLLFFMPFFYLLMAVKLIMKMNLLIKFLS